MHSLYTHLGLNISIDEIIKNVKYTQGGGTLGVLLGQEAQSQGLQAVIYTHNLMVFDPSWFDLTNEELIEKLLLQAKSKKDNKVIEASLYYAEFLKNGGDILFENLKPEFLYKTLSKYGPVICGLSATYLYMSKREFGGKLCIHI
ncbi:MAG: hypothetical protein R2827_12790 [Bdellovibrionales bacterium]